MMLRMMVTSCMSLPMMAISTMIHRMKFGTWVQFFFFVQISIILIVVQNWWNPFSILKVLYYSSRIKLVHCFKFKFSVDSDPSTVLGNCVTQGLRDSRTRERSPYQCWKNHQKEEKTTESEGKRYRVEILMAELSQVLSSHHSKAGRQALSGDTSILVM